MSNPEAEVDAAGPLPTSPEALHRRLDDLGIAYRSVSHPPVFTVEEAKALRGELPGHHIKNLFLRNKKGQMWLVTCLEDRAVDLKGLGERSEEHTSELQSLMRISYAVFCLTKKKNN